MLIRKFAQTWLLTSLALVALALPMAPVQAQQADASLYSGVQWRMIGPFRGGRTVGMSGVPGQPNVFYMGVNNGGVWKSENFGRTWEPLFKGDESNSVGDLAVAKSNPNVIYVGSGEGLIRPDLSTGDGMYKSTDAGKTWQHLGLRDGQQIASIVVDPQDENKLFVAVLGHPYGPNTERGVYRSADGGKSFQQVLYKNPDVGAVQVALDPADPHTVYAVLWATRHAPWTGQSALNGVPGSGLFKSTDDGATWKQVGQGLPTVAQGLGRIGIGIAPSDAKRIYAQVEAPPAFAGTYRSDDAGQSFQRVNDEPRIHGRGQDFAEVAVAPDNPDEIYVANTSFYRSLDAGKTFEAIKGAPGGDDYHRIWINPENPKIIALGVDQGGTLSVDGGKTWSSWYNQPTAAAYHIITDNEFPYNVYASQQESGSVGITSRSNDGQITLRDWHPVGVEEYGYVAPDPLNPNIIYGGKVTRHNRITGQTQFVGPQIGRGGEYRTNRTAPLLFSPADPHVLFYGTNVLFKTSNGGETWDKISPDLSRPNAGKPASLAPFNAKVDPRDHRGVIYSIGPSFKNVDTIWAGTDDGYIWVTRDGGKHWDNVTPKGMTGWSKVTQLVASHYDDQTAYASVSRFRLDDLKPYIYRTHDGGKTWQLIVNGLPDNASVNVVREDPEQRGLLVAGTERAVWFSADDGDHWQSLQGNLPQTSMRDLVIHDNDVVVGTHGRSFWILDDITPLRQIAAAKAAASAYLYKPAAAYQVLRNTYTDTQMPKETPAGQNPPDGAILDYYLKTAAGGPVTLEIHDAAGRLAFRLASTDQPKPVDPASLNFPTYWLRPPQVLSAAAGRHRIVWDLHYPAPQSDTHRAPISVILHDTPLGPLGPTAVPGQYTVTLSVGGQTYTQPLTLRIDPRLDTPLAGLTRQFDLATQLVTDMDRVYAAMHQAGATNAAALRELHQQLGGVYGSIYGGQYGAVSALATPTALQVSTAAELHQKVVAALGPGS
jgi:photosystem II stability/assembly factor-like uncharacterized protein